MTIAFPTSGNFIDFTDRFVDPSLAFAAGFAEWLGKARFAYLLHHLAVVEGPIGLEDC